MQDHVSGFFALGGYVYTYTISSRLLGGSVITLTDLVVSYIEIFSYLKCCIGV